MDNFLHKIQKIQDAINTKAPVIVATEAVNHFKKSFHNEAFSDKSEKDMTWKEVKRRIDSTKPERADAQRKILTGKTADLGDSLTSNIQGMDININSDKGYAEVHNKGLRAGRGKGFIMPKRQFIGESVLLKRKWTTKINQLLKSL